jgi:hypothetical protein
VVELAGRQLAAGKIVAKVGQKGGIAFVGLSEGERDGITDACLYRRLMSSGSATAKMAIERAELLAGRKVDRQAVGVGLHSHDGGATWHDHKG